MSYGEDLMIEMLINEAVEGEERRNDMCRLYGALGAKTWISANGTTISIRKMDDRHIRNCIAMLQRNLPFYDECLMSASAARPSKSLRKKRKETVMEDTKKTPAELVADLMLDPGFVLVPQDRYEELIRAETERDVLEATIKGENSYNVERVLDAIQQARSALYRMKMLVLRNADEPEATADAE